MRKYIALILPIFCLSFQINAQHQRSNKNILLQGGLTNNGVNVTAGFEKLFGDKNNNGISISLNNQQLDQSYNAVSIITNENSVFLNVGYRRYFTIANTNHLYPYIGLGILGGNQHLSAKSSSNYSVQTQNDFLYGANSSLGLEYNFSRLSLFLEGAYMFTGEHYGRANVGVKYYL